MSIERKCFLIDWNDFLEIAEESRGLGIFYKRESERTIKAAVGRYATEKTFDKEEEYNRAINKLKDLGFKEVFDSVYISEWLVK